MTKTCEICSILPDIQPEFAIYDGGYWVANLRERDQTLLGTTFITAKRHIPELDQLTPQEESEFILIRNAVLGAIRQGFHPLNFNTSCLKNDAFKNDPDHTPPEAAHVHWHIKPRYGSVPIEFGGETFHDPAPGKYLSQYERHRPRYDTAWAIADVIRSNLVL
jgi:diadenosine tetraphosphate (Ap4A) HIT family hydrolase